MVASRVPVPIHLMEPHMDQIDPEAVSMAVRRVTRRRRPWRKEQALAECQRVADLHGYDGLASRAEASRRIEALVSLRKSDLEQALAHRRAICSRYPGKQAYRVVTGEGRSPVYYCASDEEAAALAGSIPCPGARHGAQVIRLEPDGTNCFVAVI